MADTHAGTIQDPIPQQFIYKDNNNKFYTVGGGGSGGPAGTIDPRVGNLDDLTTVEKGSVVAALNEVAGKQGAGDATDTVKGISKLSDAIDSDLDARHGATAATPLAVKNVDIKIGDLTLLDTQDKSNVVNALNEIKQTGGAGGNSSYVLTPEITSPVTGSVGQNVKPTIAGTAFTSVVPGDTRKHRTFELSKEQNFATVAASKNVNADSWTVETALDATTLYYARIKDVGVKGGTSAYSVAVSFTTGAAVGPLTPTLTLKGYNDSPDDIGSGLKIVASPYTVSDGSSDIHKATSWSIKKTGGMDNVWEELNSKDYKTEVIVPEGTLEPGVSYTVSCIYHSTSYSDAAPAQLKFTTSTDFGHVITPVVTVTGYPTNITTLPAISGGVFASTRITDKHVDTEIKVVKTLNQTEVFTKTFGSGVTSVNLTTALDKMTQYTARVRYKGERLGWSEWGELSFTTSNSSHEYNYVGIPGTLDFGIGLAPPAAYESISAGAGTDEERKGHPLPGTFTHGDFQFGLYEWGEKTKPAERSDNTDLTKNCRAVYMNWYPKYYWRPLYDDASNTLLEEKRLIEDVLPYVEVTLEQLKEAQRRSPNNCIVIAPSKMFANEADANAHGFILPRSFIDGGKEQDGYFMANTVSVCAYSTADRSKVLFHGLGSQDNNVLQSLAGYTITGARLYNSSLETTPNVGPMNFAIKPLGDDNPISCMTAFMAADLARLSFCQGLYAKSTDACAWYKENLQYNCPRGINLRGLSDNNFDEIKVAVTWGDNAGHIFPAQYDKTTVTGSLAGATHISGPLWQPTIGVGKIGNKNTGILKESVALKSLTKSNITNADNYIESNMPATGMPNSSYGNWGATGKISNWASIADKNLNAVSFLYPKPSGLSSGGTVEFGQDYCYQPFSYEIEIVFGYYSDGEVAGPFCRRGSDGSYYYGWAGSGSDYAGLRVASYADL